MSKLGVVSVVAACTIHFYGPAVQAAPPRQTLCLVTHYDAAAADYAPFTVQNHSRYAKRYNYGYRAYSGRLSAARFVDESRGDVTDLFGGGLFWQKTVAVQQTLQQDATTPSGEHVHCLWVMWLDSDALITAPQTSAQAVLTPLTQQQRDPLVSVDVVLSAEADHPINTGVFFVRNSESGLGFITALQALYPLYTTSWLPEQTAMAALAYVMEPWPSNHATKGLVPTLHPAFAIAAQRTFNSFYAPSRVLAPESQWQPGDFVAHFAGTPRHMRLEAMRQLSQSHGL